MSRLFAFGCSFTNYRWSTWADCLAPEFDEFYNWGQSGAGNHFIFNSVMEADQRHSFGPDDTVVVCWTNIMRDDRYIKNRWVTLGNIADTPIYTKEFIADSVDSRGYLIRDLAFIKAVWKFLETKNVRWKFLSMNSITMEDIWSTEHVNEQDVVALYQDVLNTILPSFKQVLRPNGWYLKLLPGDDDHPSPAEHLAYLDAVLPGWVTKQETRVKMSDETKNLRKDRTGLSTVTRL